MTPEPEALPAQPPMSPPPPPHPLPQPFMSLQPYPLTQLVVGPPPACALEPHMCIAAAPLPFRPCCAWLGVGFWMDFWRLGPQCGLQFCAPSEDPSKYSRKLTA